MNDGFMTGNELYKIFEGWFDPRLNVKSFTLEATGPMEMVTLNVEYYIEPEKDINKTKIQQYKIVQIK